MTVLVTGGAGYIGSHMAHALTDRGERVVVLDNLSTGVREAVPAGARLVVGDVADEALVTLLVRSERIDAVVHFAGSIVVPESVADPLKYYRNNTAASRNLVAAAIAGGVQHFIFSSTAAVYGEPAMAEVAETTPTVPINPYGTSKLMTEWMLRDIAAAHAFRYTALRYFNVAGADPQGRTGQSTPAATHLIKVACQAALGQRPSLSVFGTDYPTRDGTCLRDYIHVTDLVAAHVLALDRLRAGGCSIVMNCGYGRGFSVLEVIAAVKRVAGVDFPVVLADRRPGDPSALIARSDRVRAELGWTPAHDDLDTIVSHAFAWERGLAARRAAG